MSVVPKITEDQQIDAAINNAGAAQQEKYAATYNNTPPPRNVVKALAQLLDYVEPDERKDYEAMGDGDNHIYHAISALRWWMLGVCSVDNAVLDALDEELAEIRLEHKEAK